MYCPCCGKAGVEKLDTCPKCGGDLKTQMNESDYQCSDCKRDVDANARYCIWCGAALDDNADESPDSRVISNEAQVKESTESPTSQGVSEIKKKKRPTSITVVTIFGFLWAIFTAAGIARRIEEMRIEFPNSYSLIFIAFVVLPIILLLYIRRMKKWAVIGFTILIAIYLILTFVGLGVSAGWGGAVLLTLPSYFFPILIIIVSFVKWHSME